MTSTVRPRSARSGALRLVAVAAAALLLALLASTAGGPGGAAPASAATALPRLDVPATYVTGISSGGYMATQLQVAWSSRFAGAGIVSAGPYWCALGTLAVALESCTAYNVPSDLPTLYAKTDEYARDGKIDPTAGLARSSTWFFHGTQDPTVVRPVADNLAAYYRHYGTPLTYRDTTAAGHGWISRLGPVACGTTAAPFINDCSPYDAQADMLRVLRGTVKAPNDGAPKGSVTAFSQDPYAAPAGPGVGDPTRTGAAAIGMGRTGYLYTPRSCASGAKCDLVVALHGCKQTADQIGTTFVERSNLNAYADTNGFAVLYPQATPDVAFGNRTAAGTGGATSARATATTRRSAGRRW